MTTPAYVQVILSNKGFIETRDPARALDTFILARSNGIDVPEETLDFLELAFREWFEKNGEVSLDSLMGISPGKGSGGSMLNPLWTKDRNRKIFKQMAVLIRLGKSDAEASDMVAAKLQQTVEKNPEHAFKLQAKAGRGSKSILDSSSILKYWRDKKRSELRKDAEESATNDLMIWTEEHKRDFLETFTNQY